MSEFTEAIKQRYFKPRNAEIQDKMNKQRVKATILSLCDNYVKEAGDILVFECGSRELQYVVEAVNEEPLKSKYNILQTNETMFEASLVEIDI